MSRRMAGARNVGAFTASIASGGIPSVSALTYEGIFSEHSFYTGHEEEQIVSCECKGVISNDPLCNKQEYYLGIFLNSRFDGTGIANRPPLNLVICLDISGSMNSQFGNGSTKIGVAKEGMKTLINQLRPNDSLSIVTFNNKAEAVLSFTKRSDMDKDKMFGIIDNITARGGTNLEIGMKVSSDQFLEYGVFCGEGGDEGIHLENRIMYFTDMQPNVGSSDGQSLLKLTKENASNGLFATFIGVGLDFNSELVEVISKTVGCNYLNINSASEFDDLMKDDFNYMVFHCASNLDVSISANDFKVERIYGSPGYEKPEGDSAVKVMCVFPSQKPKPNESVGGIIILKLQLTNENVDKFSPIRVDIQYEDRAGNLIKTSNSIENPFDDVESPFSLSTRKGILLTRYVNLMRHWMSGNSDLVSDTQGIPPFDSNQITTNGSKEHFTPLFKTFHQHFVSELEVLEDDSLQKEEKVLHSRFQPQGKPRRPVT